MHRRDLLKYLLSTPAAALVDYEKLLWVPGEKKIFLPTQNEVLHFISPALFGIPYHQSDASTRVWLGFLRDAKWVEEASLDIKAVWFDEKLPGEK